MIGVFDSGLGGLAILQGIIKILPQYSYLYVADSARSPYGNRPPQEIYDFTVQGVEYLFAQGCPLVVLGCNTASAIALREIQQKVLPEHYPDRRVLGILVPTIEQITGVPWHHQPTEAERSLETATLTVGVLATAQTVQSEAYPREIHKRNPSVKVVQQACPELVPLIEDGAAPETIKEVTKKYVEALRRKAPVLDAVLLGCTHYALVADLIAELLPPETRLYEQPRIVAESLQYYLERHPEMATRLTSTQERTFLTTGDAAKASHLGSHVFKEPITFSSVTL